MVSTQCKSTWRYRRVNERSRILLIEDSEDDAILLERQIRKGNMELEMKRVCTSDEMKEALSTSLWDAIICDYMMPEFSVNDALDIVRNAGVDIPFIIVSGTISDETAVDMMKAGAHDYITKNNLSRLVPALEREMIEAEHRHQRSVAEEALRESERKHRMLIESLNDTVIVFGSEGSVSEFYSQTPIVQDLTIEKHLGKSIPEIFIPSIVKTITELVKATLDNKITTTFEYPMNVKWFSAKLSPHEDGVSAVMVLREVSDLKQAEEEARQAHGVAMLYQDITGHDIRNLLQAIMIASDLLTSDETDQSKLSLLHHVTEAVKETSSLITSVQATAALLSTPLEKTSLDFTLKSCVKIFNEEHKDVDVESKVEVSEAVVNADRFLCHMLMNVFSNAVKHNNCNERQIWARLAAVEGGYEITIADNGPGIKDSQKKNLLSPERRSGGVGILQCIQIANKYGGAFEIHDRVAGSPEKGAKFRLWLPKAYA
ncbi:MAG: response regulator [Candidatus Thorarchaeota archaeon]|nr:MAG: response regulator [Candidatus Thorarchaeota archaeon]